MTGLVFALCGVMVSACGGPSGVKATYAASGGSDDRLSNLTEMDQRVARVAQRLLTANTDLCPVVRESAGWSLHSANQYREQLRRAAVERFGLYGDLPGILAAPDDSPAAQAGLRQGDLILSVNDIELEAGDTRTRPRFEGLATNTQVLDRALSSGPTRLRIRRSGREIPATVIPRRSCGYDVQLNPSDELNARADGRRLYISTALTAFAANDDELAIILGHELAHHVLRHRAWDETGGAGRTVTEASTNVIARDDPERQADRVGMFLAARAGFDTAVAESFWRRFGASNWRVRYPQLGHDSAGARALAVARVEVEIEALRRRGAPLVY